MWCDDFDADLLKVVPGAAEALGDTAAVRLLTYSRPTGGKINCPSSWNGVGALFWTAPEHKPDACYYTDAPVTPCTFLEAVRDEWVHDSALVVNGALVWQAPVRLMERLMYDVRGWTVLTDGHRAEVRGHVLASLDAAARQAPDGDGMSLTPVGDRGCCAGGHPSCTYDAGWREACRSLAAELRQMAAAVLPQVGPGTTAAALDALTRTNPAAPLQVSGRLLLDLADLADRKAEKPPS
jgi:hypothetical protein